MEQMVEMNGDGEHILCSVIIRTKDRPRHLYRCLESLRMQDRKSDEVIVVNDGGESIESVIEAFADLPIVLIVNKVSQGRSAAGNIGADAASFDAICFLDDDDRFLPDHLRRLALSMFRFDAKVAYSGSRLVLKDMLGENDPEQTQEIGEFNDPFDPDRLAFENYIPLNTLLIDRKLFLEIGGFDPAFSLFEDWDLLFRLSMRTKFYHLNRVTSEYAIWGKSHQITLLSRTEHWRDAYMSMFKKNFLAFPDTEKVKRMADYWILSQERRSKIQELEKKLEHYVRENEILSHKLHQEKDTIKHISLCEIDNLKSQLHRQEVDFEHSTELLNGELHRQKVEFEQATDLLNGELHRQKVQFEQATEQLNTRYNKKINVLKSALQRQKAKKALLYQVIDEQNRQIALGVGNHAIRELFSRETSNIEHLSSNVIKTNYDCLAEWIKSNEVFFNDNIKVLYNQTKCLHIFKREIGILEEKIEYLLNQLYNSKLKKIWRGIPIPQVTSILEKNREISQLLSDVSVNSISFNNTTLFIPKAKKTIREDLIEDITEYVPAFEAFAGGEDKPELMIRVHLPEIQTNPVPIKSNNRLCFSIYSDFNGFFSLKIMFATYIRINTCDVKIAIFDIINENIFQDNIENRQLIEPLRICEFNAIDVLDNQYHTVIFNPILDSKGKTYKIEITSPNATDEHHLAVWCYPPNSIILSDTLKQNMVLGGGIHSSNSLLSWDTYENGILYPSWMRQLFTETLLLPLLISGDRTNIKHRFCIYNRPKVGFSSCLPLVLLQLAYMTQQKNQSISIIIYGETDPVTEDYCNKNAIEYLVIEETVLQKRQILSFVFEYIIQHLNNIDSECDGLLWFFQSDLIPTKESIDSAELHFKDYPDTGILLPLIKTNDNKIANAFGQITREGNINTFSVGSDIVHPSNGYVREVDAADSPFFVISSASLVNLLTPSDVVKNKSSLDFKIALISYKTVSYQLTELIWQLTERGFIARFDPDVAFSGERFQDKASNDLLEQDRLTFLNRWKSKLLHKPFIYDDRCVFLNPQRKRTALIIDMTLPTFDEDSGSLRMYELIKLMTQIGVKITFFPANLDSKPKYRRALEHLGIEVFCGNYGIADALESRKYDIIILSRVEIGYRYMNLVKLLNPKAKIYYDTVDIHYVRELRQSEIENSEQLGQQAVKTRQKELANCIMADVVFTVTEDDKKHLLKEIPALSCFVMPNIHRELQFDISWENTDGLVFIGNYNHTPNQDAVFYFVENVFPMIQAKIPEIKLYLIGSYMRDRMKALASQSIKILGWIEKVEPELVKRRVMVSYLRYGAGMKGKIGQAMSLGLPVVSTSIGAEGMGLKDGETIMVADDPDSFAENVCKIYKDKSLWKIISQNSKNYIYSQYGIEAVKSKLKEFLDREL